MYEKKTPVSKEQAAFLHSGELLPGGVFLHHVLHIGLHARFIVTPLDDEDKLRIFLQDLFDA